jgi:hypothetical protein
MAQLESWTLTLKVAEVLGKDERYSSGTSGEFTIACQRSSGVEQRFRKPSVVGSNPTAGWG